MVAGIKVSGILTSEEGGLQIYRGPIVGHPTRAFKGYGHHNHTRRS